MIYSGLRHGALFNSRFWVLQPIALMLITGLAFVLLSFGLNKMRGEQSRFGRRE